MDKILIKDNERVDDLQVNGLKLIQNPEWFCFGIDAVLLADFAQVTKDDVIVEFGAGNGIIPILLAGKKKCKHVCGIEIQPEIADIAKRNVRLNNLEGNVRIIEGDFKDEKLIQSSSVDAVISNPPYKEIGGGLLSQKNEKFLFARHEVKAKLEDVLCQSRRILRSKGKLYLVHRPERLVDILTMMRLYKLEPKKIRLIHPSADKRPNILLVEAVADGNPQLVCEKPLFVYDDNGEYTKEINEIYGRGV